MRKTAFALILAGTAVLTSCTVSERAIQNGMKDYMPYAERRCQELGIKPDNNEFAACVDDKARRRVAMVTCTQHPGWWDMDPAFCRTGE